MAGSVMFPALVGVARVLEALGTPRAAMEEVVGRPLEVTDPDLRVSSELLLQLYELTLKETGRRDLPIVVGSSTGVENLGVMGFTIVTAPDGPTACARAARYARVPFDMGFEWRAEDEGDRIRISIEAGLPNRLGEQISIESGLTNFVHCFRQVSRQDMRPDLVRFPHPAPPDTTPHRTFFKAPVEFNAGACDFVFDRGYAERAIVPKSDPAMNAFFTQYADRLLEEHVDRDQTVEEQTRAYIERHLADGEPTADGAAKSLALSPRSFRRALQQEETSFRQILDEIRLSRAETLLTQAGMTVSETAYLLGFADLTAFSRAFKRWTGTSPREFRQTG